MLTYYFSIPEGLYIDTANTGYTRLQCLRDKFADYAGTMYNAICRKPGPDALVNRRYDAFEDIDALILFHGWHGSEACREDLEEAPANDVPVFVLAYGPNGIELRYSDGRAVEQNGLPQFIEDVRRELKERSKIEFYDGMDPEPRVIDGDEEQDNVNHPAHYQIGDFECFDEMLELFGVDAVLSYCRLAVYKYRYRHTKKNGAEDLKKAGWYMRKIKELEAQE